MYIFQLSPCPDCWTSFDKFGQVTDTLTVQVQKVIVSTETSVLQTQFENCGETKQQWDAAQPLNRPSEKTDREKTDRETI